MISRSQMNRQLYQMGGEGMQAGMQEGIMQMAPQEMQNQSMQPQMQSMQAPLQNQEQPQLDPNQAIEILVRMLMEQGIPQEEAIKIAMQMIQAVSEGGMQEVSDDTRIEARFGGRMGYADGGISRLVDREQYGFGSVFKSVGKIVGGAAKAVSGAVKGVTKAVKKVASSDLGKIALMAAAIYAGGGGFSPDGFSLFGSPAFGAEAATSGLLGSGGQFSLGSSFLGNPLTRGINQLLPASFGSVGNIASSLIPGKGTLISAGAGLLGGALAGGMQPPEQQVGESPEQYQARVAEFQKQYQSNLGGTTGYNLPAGANNPFYSDYQYAANGGRIGYQEGGIGNVITQATQEAFFGQPQMPMMANGGRMGYAMGNSVQQGIMAAPQIANQMNMPVGTPRMNEGGVPELDYRDEGGFVPPIGIKERADDIPAMLSNNEFVFTADAVKNADPEGEKDPERGAREMYVLMKRLENGGVA
jgi:hypothetical protein